MGIESKYQRLAINNFKGLSTRNHARLIDPQKAATLIGIWRDKKAALVPMENIRLETITAASTPRGSLAETTSLIPTSYTNGNKYLLITDSYQWIRTTGDQTFTFPGYSTGTATRSGTALTGASTVWFTNITTSDKFKYDADSTWLSIAAVNSDTSITLGSDAGATSGAYTIAKIMNGRNRERGVMMNDLAILCDGVRIADKYDGSSMQLITGMPIVEYLVVHKRHVFGAIESTIYWSNINTGITWTGTDTEVVASKDGGRIAGLHSFGNSLVIVKSNNKIYQFIGQAPFSATAVSYQIVEADVPQNIGNFAPETFSVHNGLLYFLTSTGVWVFDGVNFERISDDILTTIDSMVVPSLGTTSSATFLDDTSAEFDAGTDSDTEYDTTDAVLQLDQTKLFDDFTDGDYTSSPTWTSQVGTWTVTSNQLQSTVSNSRITVESTNAYGQWQAKITSHSDTASFASAYWDVIASSSSATYNGYQVEVRSTGTIALNKITSGSTVAFLIIGYGAITDGTQHTIILTRTSAGLFELFVDGVSKGTATDTTYTTSTHMQCKFQVGTSGYAKFDDFNLSATSGNFISQVFDGTADLSVWSKITVNGLNNNGGSIQLAYRAEASNPPTGSFTNISSGQTIAATNRYLQYKVIFTGSASQLGLSPTLTSVTTNYTKTTLTTNAPAAISFKNRWHLSYSTAGNNNNSQIILDKDNEWANHGEKASLYAVFNDNLYGAYPSNKIIVFYQTDTTTGVTRSWKSAIIDGGFPELDKDFDRVLIVFKPTSASVSVDYSVDEGSFVTSSQALTAPSDSSIHLTVPINKSGKRIQLRLNVSDETTDFEIQEVILFYRILELTE